jgi:hypothetical protein
MRHRDRWSKLYETDSGVTFLWIATLVLLGGMLYPASVAAWYTNFGKSVESDWVHHMLLRKEAALALAPGGPRVLVVGGSGCLFSVDSAVLSRELGKPVINLCTHAGIGLEYFLARARRHARRGDTVLLSIEYRVLHVTDERPPDLGWKYFTTWDRAYYADLGIPGAYRALYRIPFAGLWESREGWRRMEGYREVLANSYDVMALTPEGDLHESIGNRGELIGNVAIQFLPPSHRSKELLTAFAGWARDHGVEVVATYQAAALNPPDYWRAKDYFAQLPAWWASTGIRAIGTPEAALWPSTQFMDTLQHAGPAAAYQHSVRIAEGLRSPAGARPGKVLLLPPHPARHELPFPPRDGATVEIDTDDDAPIRAHLAAGRRVIAATAALGERLRARGFGLRNVRETTATPAEVLRANRDKIIAVCLRPGAPAALEGLPAGPATAALWRNGQWETQSGPASAVLTATFSTILASGRPLPYRVQINASAAACELQFYERERYPSPAPIRMAVIDPQRGITTGIYQFEADLRATTAWRAEVTLP